MDWSESSLTHVYIQVIAIHTFFLFWQDRSMDLRYAWVIVFVIWLYPILFIAINIGVHGGDGAFQPSGVRTMFS